MSLGPNTLTASVTSFTTSAHLAPSDADLPSEAAKPVSGALKPILMVSAAWALIGAKLLLVLVELPRYLKDPASILGTIRAGGVFLGGFVAAVIAAIVLLRRYKLPALPSFDVLSPSLALGHAIGRIGCLLAGCCWGAACELPWAITYSSPIAAEIHVKA